MVGLFFLVAFGAGVAISVQASINSQLAGGMGGNTIAAALFSFLTGTIILATIAVLSGGLVTAVATIPGQPWWRLMGGLLGAGAIFSTVLLAPRIGLANLLALVIVGQLLSSFVIDNFGLLGVAARPVSGIKLVGAVVLIGGVLLTLFGDRIVALTSGRGSA